MHGKLHGKPNHPIFEIHVYTKFPFYRSNRILGCAMMSICGHQLNTEPQTQTHSLPQQSLHSNTERREGEERGSRLTHLACIFIVWSRIRLFTAQLVIVLKFQLHHKYMNLKFAACISFTCRATRSSLASSAASSSSDGLLAGTAAQHLAHHNSHTKLPNV